MDNIENIEYRKSSRWYVVGLLFTAFFFLLGLSGGENNYSVAVLVLILVAISSTRYYSQRIFLKDSSINLIRDIINTKDIDIPYSKIDSVKVNWEWANAGTITISASGVEYCYKSMNNISDLQNELNERMNGSLANSRSSIIKESIDPESNTGNNYIDELEKLATLKTNGVLSDDEFNSMKQKIISR